MQIEIAGKQLQLRFGMHLGEMLLKDATGKKHIGTLQFMAALIYYAHENYCLGHDLTPAVTKGEVFTYLEDNGNDEALVKQLADVVVAYNDSKPAQVFNEAAKPAAKKKLTGQK